MNILEITKLTSNHHLSKGWMDIEEEGPSYDEIELSEEDKTARYLPVNVPASVFTKVCLIPTDSSRTVDFIETCSWISSLLLHGSLYAVLPTESQNKYEGENEPPDIENKFSPGLFTSTRLRHLAFYPV